MLLRSYLCQGSPGEQDKLVVAHLSQHQCTIKREPCVECSATVYVPLSDSFQDQTYGQACRVAFGGLSIGCR